MCNEHIFLNLGIIFLLSYFTYQVFNVLRSIFINRKGSFDKYTAKFFGGRSFSLLIIGIIFLLTDKNFC